MAEVSPRAREFGAVLERFMNEAVRDGVSSEEMFSTLIVAAVLFADEFLSHPQWQTACNEAWLSYHQELATLHHQELATLHHRELGSRESEGENETWQNRNTKSSN